MPDLTIYKKEFVFLKEKILEKYASLEGYTYAQFEEQLTGKISIYDDIAKVMQKYIDNETNFLRYAILLEEGAFKISIDEKKNSGKANDISDYLNLLKNFATANLLRKLIYPKPEEKELTFRQGFINACYFYIHQDRICFLRKHPVEVMLDKAKTEPFPDKKGGNIDTGKTEPVHGKEPVFVLRALNEKNEIAEEEKPLPFRGNHTALNRSNLDPDNFTITRKVQAEISCIDGEWFIENQSQLFTTFILVNKPTKISKGDIIVLGNKKFLFE